MVTPNFDIKLPTPSVWLAIGIAFSYFSHVGWWALAYIAIFFTLLTKGNWLIFWFILSFILLGLGIWKMGWIFF